MGPSGTVPTVFPGDFLISQVWASGQSIFQASPRCRIEEQWYQLNRKNHVVEKRRGKRRKKKSSTKGCYH